MKSVWAIRTIGWVQLVVSIILAVGITTSYFSYRSALADYSGALATSMLSVSDYLTITAEKVTARRELLHDVERALKISGDVLVALKSSGETQAEKMPQYSADLRKAAVVTANLGNTLNALGDKLLLRMPIDIDMHLTKRPEIVWARPFEAQAKALKTHGQNINELSGNFIAIADSLITDVPRLNAALIGLSQKSLVLLHDMETVTSKLGPQVLAQTIEALKTASSNLRQASDLANSAEQMGRVLFAASLFLALLLALNSVAILLLSPESSKG